LLQEEAEWRRQQAQAGRGGRGGGQSPRRLSHIMQRQHSYDEEESQSLSAQPPQFELSRRASAYDVYQTAGMAKVIKKFYYILINYKIGYKFYFCSVPITIFFYKW